MTIPRFVSKELSTEIPHLVQNSAQGQTVPLGGTLTHTKDFNIALAGFLNPFGLSSPLDAELIAAGHVAYVCCRFAAGAATGAVLCELHAQFFAGGTFYVIANDILAAPATPGVAQAGRYDVGGAAWALRFVFRNTGTSNATALEYAVAVRAY